MVLHKSASELEFEEEVVKHLTTIGGSKQWQYVPEIKTTEQLWANFKRILEQNNPDRIDGELSKTEFAQVKKVISNLKTPYEAGQFLYGVNGVSQIEVDLDNGKHVFLTVFDKEQVGGGNTVYQVVNQIQREKVIDGRPNRRFDVTLLINGLPLIQIELKAATHSASEALNQMEQYIGERQYGDIFSTLQVLVAMTKYDIRYMANTVREQFNKAFAFKWQREETAEQVHDWREFADKVLSIPMAHELSTRYMILDKRKNHESIKVMRPYQVYATKRVIDAVREYDFSLGTGRLGYVWHTTGSGKTITSFKTAWLASRLPNVSKVVFLVDRVALTNQTVDAYRAYDPAAAFDGKTGVIADTANVKDLRKKLKSKSDSNIIVTSIQKMARYVQRSDFKEHDENILFIVDEAHRSTGKTSDSTGMLEVIREAIPRSAWIGYTGTPRFSDKGSETFEVFGKLLHAYTIKEAIADRNVLGFHVEFKDTIGDDAPANPSAEEIDDNLKASVYDYSEKHLQEVVRDIVDNWRVRSNNRRYNAMFTVHVGGNNPSTPRAMQYFDEFQRVNETLPPEERIKVAVSFSADTSNSDSMVATNDNLVRAISAYNDTFGTSFDLSTVREYTDNVASRLNRTIEDRNYLDLVIVIDQLLTGFDAPELNTLYVDRTLKGASLIQAYSRTNRMHKLDEKPWGNVINYRWPVQNEAEMNKAFYVYSNRASAIDALVDTEGERRKRAEENVAAGIIAQDYYVIQEELKQTVAKIKEITPDCAQVPASEQQQEELFKEIRTYNSLLNKLKQFSSDAINEEVVNPYTDPEKFYEEIGITVEETERLSGMVLPELRDRLAEIRNIDVSEIEVSLHHISDVRINYDYLTELLAQMADAVNERDMEQAQELRDDLYIEIAKSDSDAEAAKLREFTDAIYSGEYKFDDYPAPRNTAEMQEAMERARAVSHHKLAHKFIGQWGLMQVASAQDIVALISKHRYKQQDLNKQGEVGELIRSVGVKYKSDAEDAEVRDYSPIKYRNEFQKALYALADQVRKGE